MGTVHWMVALLCLTPVDRRFNGCKGDDGPAEEDHGHTLSSYVYTFLSLLTGTGNKKLLVTTDA